MKTTVLFLLTVLVGFAAGCNNSVNTISNAGVNAEITRVNDLRVNTDSRLAKRLCLTEIRESETNDGFKRIQVFLKNTTNSTYFFVYRFDWYDNKGVEVEIPDGDGWIRKSVVAGDDITLTSVAPKKECADFKLHLKTVE